MGKIYGDKSLFNIKYTLCQAWFNPEVVNISFGGMPFCRRPSRMNFCFVVFRFFFFFFFFRFFFQMFLIRNTKKKQQKRERNKKGKIPISQFACGILDKYV